MKVCLKKRKSKLDKKSSKSYELWGRKMKYFNFDLSNDSMVIAPARTGKYRSNKIAVIKTAQANKGVRSKNIPILKMKTKYYKIEDRTRY